MTTNTAVGALEVLFRRLGLLMALAAGISLLPGVAAVTRPTGRTVGRPEQVFSPVRMALIALGWFVAAVVLWRPLPVHLGTRTRAGLLVPAVAAYVMGLGLAMAGRIALGAAYRPTSTVGVRLAPGQALVTSGPYALVRHPMYVGIVLAALGALGLYRTWTTLLFIAQLPVLYVRARREDEALEAEFGAAWRRYHNSVPAWLPRPGGCQRRARDPGSGSDRLKS